ncbi:MAG TPA: tetratricopeptide repeat protein [Albitalea sp.]|jgi:tetratricopeptide (TPR) repeat protein|nr:tetratricopeptide repeat protein [Albitalea sp.]
MFPPLHLVMRRLAAALLCCACACVPAWADEPADINRLFAAGHSAEAMARLDQLLAQRPRDSQLRFQKGTFLAELQRSAEAMDIFTQLTVDYPEIPEPYNNLAVLYAARGEYDKARAALEAALRANPNYAVAHQNLGDIQTQLARQSYARALQLDPSNPLLPPKLALLREIVKPVEAAAKRPTP